MTDCMIFLYIMVMVVVAVVIIKCSEDLWQVDMPGPEASASEQRAVISALSRLDSGLAWVSSGAPGRLTLASP